MCGIAGYVGTGHALPFILQGLGKLEYRGYDSAGFALIENGSLVVKKAAGRLSELVDATESQNYTAACGIGHTRWATHGRPTAVNAHPHTDCTGRFAVIHNGIIENFRQIKEQLISRGHKFSSDTDTEIIPHLIEECFRGDLASAVREVVNDLRGSYALVVVAADCPEQIVAVRKHSPLVLGLGEGENYLASDIPALLAYTRDTIILEDDELAVLSPESVQVYDSEGAVVQKDVLRVDWDPGSAERGGYAHFMLKEIHEQPKAVFDTLSGRISEDFTEVILPELDGLQRHIEQADRIVITACGTAYHAGLVTKWLLERLARVPVEVEVASEFRYREPIIDQNSLVLVISQSGETADTLAGLREAKTRGAKIIAITNVVGSSVAREAHHVIYTHAGPEIAVASTKAYVTQLVAGALLAMYVGRTKSRLGSEEMRPLLEELAMMPEKITRTLGLEPEVETLAREISHWPDAFFLGRGLDFAVSLEGQLKLKEISYIHAEGFAAGELKHGALALVTEGLPVIALATQTDLLEKMVGNIAEVRARGGYIIGVGCESGKKTIGEHTDRLLVLPDTHPWLMPILAVLPLQLLSYYTAVAKGTDVDKPRNLAKSVTVE